MGSRARACLGLMMLSLVAMTPAVAHAVATAADGPSALTAGRSWLDVPMPDGSVRRALLYVPPSLATGQTGPPRVVIALHGGLGSAERFARASDLEVRADRHGFLLALGQGGPGLRWGRDDTHATWDAGGCCGGSTARGDDDVAYLDSLIDRLVDDLGVDPLGVVLTGHSNGAMMTFRYVCEGGRPLDAAIPVAGSLETDRGSPCEPHVRHLVAVHGDADELHPIDGGHGAGLAGVPFAPFADSVARVAVAAGCDRAPDPAIDGVVTTSTFRCPDGIDIRALVLADAGHPWPGSPVRGISGVPFAAWSASDLVATLVATDVDEAGR